MRSPLPVDRASHDRSLSQVERRARGVYYTPPEVVGTLLDELLPAKVTRSFTLLDPACGDGAFLRAVAERWRRTHPRAAPRWVAERLFGIDRDATAITLAREQVARAALGDHASPHDLEQLMARLEQTLIVGDTLCDPLPSRWPTKGFAAIVGNPPYVNIRRLAKDALRQEFYRERYRSATGAFDLYVLFLERAFELLAPDGRCVLLVPNKLASLDYAAACRSLLAEETVLERVLDFSRCRLFAAASVYPLAICFRRRAPSGKEQVRIDAFASPQHTEASTTYHVPQSTWQGAAQWSWEDEGSLLHNIATLPLGTICRLHSGTTGFAAQKMLHVLREAESDSSGDKAAASDASESFEFLVSGNVDRYHIRRQSVRFMKRLFARPLLARQEPLLSPRKRALFANAKIIFSGLSRRLEAAWDPGGCALGVQVFAAAEFQHDPFYLLALLNSAPLTQWFRGRFGAKRLSGDYLSVNLGQLAQLPIADPARLSLCGRRCTVELANLARECVELSGRGVDWSACDAEIDQLVLRLYGSAVAKRPRAA